MSSKKYNPFDLVRVSVRRTDLWRDTDGGWSENGSSVTTASLWLAAEDPRASHKILASVGCTGFRADDWCVSDFGPWRSGCVGVYADVDPMPTPQERFAAQVDLAEDMLTKMGVKQLQNLRAHLRQKASELSVPLDRILATALVAQAGLPVPSTYVAHVWAPAPEQADQVMQARMGHDEDLGFDYKVDHV